MAPPRKILHYDVLETLGEGARSTIYAVSDPETRQVYALKHVARSVPKDIRFIEQMETEYEVSKDLVHPNLRRCFDLKISRTLLLKVTEAFMLMELVDGKPLDVRMPTGMVDIIDTFIQVAQGLRAMHSMGYVHCDMKPNNVLRNDAGVVKVIDFGQACKIGTIKERIQGTPDYIAPEQVSRRPINQQTDIFNFGATMYWALTGQHIPTMYTVNKKGSNSFLLDTRFQSPIELNPKVPIAVSNLVMNCIATKPQKRPSDLDQVIARLELGKHVLQRGKTNDADRKAVDDSLSADDTHI